MVSGGGVNGILLMLLADLAFALMASAAKEVGGRIPAAEIVFVRSVLSLAAAYWLLRVNRIPLRGKNPPLLWARGVIGYAALQCYFWALPQIPLGTAVMLNYTAPIFAVLFSFLLLGERPPLPVKTALAVSFLGIYLLAWPRFDGALPVAALAAGLASGILAGSVHVMIRHTHKSDPPLLVIFYFVLSSMIGSGLALCGAGWTPPTPPEWLGLVFITATSFMGQLYMTRSLQRAPVWVVSPFGYLTPVLAFLLGVFLWGELPHAASLTGAGIVIVCGVLMLAFFRPPDNAR